MPVVRFPEVLTDLRTKILDGTHPAGEPLAHTEDLMRTYGVSRQVITNAMRALKEEGLVWRVANKGMIVLGPAVVIQIPMAIDFRDEPTAWAAACRRAGTTGHLTTVLSRATPATEEVAHNLRLPAKAKVIISEIRGEIEGQLVCLDQLYWSRERHDAGSYDVERSTGLVELQTRVRPAGPKEALTFRVSRGSPLLDLTRITCNQAGEPLQLLRRLANPQRVHIVDQRLPLTSP
ncbi:DNA-binding transcriptional regulator, GntR family [Nonomuraea solani]|uniref:DNA-binding transcriptional regulator, GntR family n=1 Tax=Nonomuraea solani TaxID=1144553 RepID=A0A1H6DKJ5_9ACTN|nr:GntR family transcriptional regulator [Nonomuraea solani]SEG85196.1 DNA-binding transcriptional regulator, GntR family [Nonomuraea solani]